MKQTAVEWYEKEINSLLEKYESKEISTLDFIIIKHNLFDRAKEMEKEQQDYSKEEVLPLLEMLQKCKEYFLLKTDLKNEERADAIGQVLENFKKK
jgi:hypothetical protein